MSELTGPSKKKEQADALCAKANWHREQARLLDDAARDALKNCDHTFDDGECATENKWLYDACVICGH
jgi:hypothetical protein